MLPLRQVGLAMLIKHDLRTWHCHLLRCFPGCWRQSEPSASSALTEQWGCLRSSLQLLSSAEFVGCLQETRPAWARRVPGEWRAFSLCVSTGPVEECRVFEVGSSGFRYTPCLQSLPFICRYRKGTASVIYLLVGSTAFTPGVLAGITVSDGEAWCLL